MLRAVVVGHGEFAAGLISAVREISGRDERFVALSNQDFGPEELEQRLRDEVATRGASVVFTDLPGGSAAMAARRVMRDRPELLLVTGANLAALLEFALTTEPAALDAARIAASKGQSAIGLVARS